MRNKEQVADSSQVGCYYCLRSFPADEVTEYHKEADGGETAICPRCGIDSVIGDAVGIALTDENLEQMNRTAFRAVS